MPAPRGHEGDATGHTVAGKARKKGLTRGEDFALYGLVGVAMVGAVFFSAAYTRIESHVLFKWAGFAIMTAIVFGDSIRLNRSVWSPRFFAFLFAALCVQCAVAISALWTVPKISPMVWALLMPFDYLAVGAFLGYFVESPDDWR